jgi:serine/threonine protein phosphatase PrpC
MSNELKVSVGQYSDKGRKEINQDFHGVSVPKEPQLSTKGVAIALADGISSSGVSQIASSFAVTGFLEDYYCTSDAWSVKTAAERVLGATNSWLYSQTQQSQYRYDKDRGYVCTLSAMVIKSMTAHLFHAGDTRIYRVQGNSLEQLTRDHRVWVSPEQSYLGRAMGVDSQIEIDYLSLPVERGDIFLLATDGLYEHVDAAFILGVIEANTNDLDAAARLIGQRAFEQGSADNITLQILRIDALPNPQANEIFQQISELPFAPALEARMELDGYRIIREVHASSRSHIYLAEDIESKSLVVLKTPSVDLRNDPAYLERFLMEEWIARRINSPHVLKPCQQTRKHSYLYVAMEYIEGQTLAQWMIDNPRPELDAVRGIVDQIAKGLRAFHRMEMLYQDVRPENVMIDTSGTVKIIDFGSTRVAGILEMAAPVERSDALGTVAFMAPEYFLGESGTTRSDQFSLGVLAYQMLTGKLPYGAEVAKCKTRAQQRNLNYQPLSYDARKIPSWIDEAIRKAVHPLPEQRYEDILEFIYDLHHPNKEFLSKRRPPLIERNPLAFWKGLSLFLVLVIFALLIKR